MKPLVPGFPSRKPRLEELCSADITRYVKVFLHSRSLLASETLEDDLCVGVDPQVVDSLGVGAGAGAVSPLRRLAQDGTRRSQLSRKGLHRDRLQIGRDIKKRERGIEWNVKKAGEGEEDGVEKLLTPWGCKMES